MEVRSRAALLLALAGGPAYGLELIERVAQLSNGLLHLNRGGAYVALRTLEAQGLVRAWLRRLPRAGRPRLYYELTPRGMVHTEQLRRAVGLLARPVAQTLTPGASRRMAERLKKAGALSESVIRLRDAGMRGGV